MKIMLLRCCTTVVLAIALSTSSSLLSAEPAAPVKELGRMPIKEITVFKDGHAFIAQEGSMPVDTEGNVLLDQLPAPVIGTFWPYSKDKNAKLRGVVASEQRVSVERTALNVRELLEANKGAEAIITEINTNRYEATIIGIPTRSAEELEATSPPNSPMRLPESGNIILLKTAEGVKAVNIDRIQDVTFKQMNKSRTSKEEFRNLLTLKLDWGRKRAAEKADVGLLYLQKGVRWIPSYRVTLDGKGNAVVKLQATLINELMDFTDANVNLVVGVPTFSFKETMDPISLQQTAAQLSQYFQNNQAGNFGNNAFALNFNNAIASQSVRMSEFRNQPDTTSTEPEDSGLDGSKAEDLFVYNAGHITLKRGERMVISIAEFTIPYKDVFTLELPFAPPPEMNRSINNSQQQELARLLRAPKVMYKIRLHNKSRYPLTTAPALVFLEGRILSQGMMTYTAIGAESDLAVTSAVDISVKKSDVESSRTPKAMVVNGNQYTRVDLDGRITLVSHRSEPVDLEVVRYILGNVQSAGNDGKAEKLNGYEEADHVQPQPYWWGWYGWPYWWSSLNGVSRVTWDFKLAPGESVQLEYKWNYFWQN